MRVVWRVGLLLLLLASMVLPAFPVQTAQAGDPLSYPVLSAEVQYYQTTFPVGLKYSPGWYGTFRYAPKAAEILLFDDDWTADFGRCIFSMPVGVVPTGEQGGTTLTPISLEVADAILKSYPLTVSSKPYSAEINAVMDINTRFTGVWSGEKLKQKWDNPAYIPDSMLTASQKEFRSATSGKDVKTVDLSKYDPDRYWVGDGGNWSDNTTHWSASTGGAPGASLPTSADNVFFDGASFTLAGQIVTVDAAADTLSMDWTGATNAPTLAFGANDVNVYGGATFSATMTVTSTTGKLNMLGTGNLTTNGISLPFTWVETGGTVTLVDSLNTGSKNITLYRGTLVTSSQNITNTGTFAIASASAKTLTPGSSVITTGAWNYSGSNFSITANTSNITVTGTGVFAGGNIQTYNSVNLNGASHTVSGNFSTSIFSLPAWVTQTITFTDGYNTTATTFNLSGSAGHVHTLQGSGAAGWSITKAAGTVSADYVNLSNSKAAGGATFNAVGASINGGGNTGWNFLHTVTTQAASGVTMDKDGTVGGNLNGTLVDMGGVASNNVSFEYGSTIAYGSSTALVAKTAPGTFSAAIPALTPGQTYHYRAVSAIGSTNATGADQSFTFTMPTVTASAATIGADATAPTLHGNLTNMGASSSTSVAFQYSYSSTFVTFTTTPLVTKSAAGTFSVTLSGINPAYRLYFRAIAQNTPTIATSSTVSYLGGSTGPGAGAYLLYYTFLLIAAAGVIIVVLVSMMKAGVVGFIISSLIGLIGFSLLATTLNTVILGG